MVMKHFTLVYSYITRNAVTLPTDIGANSTLNSCVPKENDTAVL